MIQLSQKRLSYLQEAICISIAICFGVSIYLGFRITNGYWIPMTTAIMFASAHLGQGAVIKKTLDRSVGTISGALLCFLFLNIFTYGNYHWAYIAPLIFFLGWYAFYLTDNYLFYAAMITAFTPLIISMTTLESISISDILIKRIACTFLGLSIAIIAEIVIYRDAASTIPAMKQAIEFFFQKQGEIIRLASGHFLDKTYKTGFVREEFKIIHRELISSIATIENLHLSVRYEFNHKEDQNLFYQSLFRHLIEINRKTRRIVGIIGHDKYNGNIFSAEELTELGVIVSEKYKNMQLYFDGKVDDTSEKILSILKNIEYKDRSNPAYFFIKALYKLSVLADELSLAVYNIKLK